MKEKTIFEQLIEILKKYEYEINELKENGNFQEIMLNIGDLDITETVSGKKNHLGIRIERIIKGEK